MTGNWNEHIIKSDASTTEMSEAGTLTKLNKWTSLARTIPSSAPDTLPYDAVGNMTGNGKGESYVYDGFGRLKEVRVVSGGSSNGNIKAAY
jgi:YD repeat-containing protein